MSDVIGKLQFLIDVDSSTGVAEIKKFSNSTEDAAKNSKTSLNSIVKSLTGVNLGTLSLATAAVAAFKKIITKCIELQKSYENTRATIAKATGATGKDLKALTQSAVALAGYTGKSMEEVGVAIGEINTRFAVTGIELRNLTKDFLDFSNVTGQDVKSAVTGVSQVMNKWNLKNTTELMDKLTVASQAGGISVSQLENELTQFGSTLKIMGMSLDDSIALFTQLERQGISSSEVIMGMKKIVADGAKEGLTAGQAWQKYTDEIKNATSVTDAMDRATELFGERLAADLVDAIRDGKLNFEEFKKVLEESEGALKNTRDAARTTGEAIGELRSSFKETNVTIKEFSKTFSKISIEDYISKFEELSDAEQKAFAPKLIDKYVQAFEKGNITFEQCVNSISRMFKTEEEFNAAIAEGTFLSYEAIKAIKETIKVRTEREEEKRIMDELREKAKAEEEQIERNKKALISYATEGGKRMEDYYKRLENEEYKMEDFYFRLEAARKEYKIQEQIKAEEKYKNALSATQKVINGISSSWSYVYGVVSDIYSKQVALEDKKLEQLLSNREADIASMEEYTDAQIKEYERQLQAGMITQSEYERKVKTSQDNQARYVEQRTKQDAKSESELRQKLNDLEYKQFVANKANAIAQAVINGAGAIVKAYEQLGPIAGSVAAITIGTLTGVQIAAISGEEFTPSYRKGASYVPYDTMAQVHRGETILRPEDAQRFRDLGGIYGLDRAVDFPETDIATRQTISLNNNMNAVIEVDGVQLGIAVLKNIDEASTYVM